LGLGLGRSHRGGRGTFPEGKDGDLGLRLPKFRNNGETTCVHLKRGASKGGTPWGGKSFFKAGRSETSESGIRKKENTAKG